MCEGTPSSTALIGRSCFGARCLCLHCDGARESPARTPPAKLGEAGAPARSPAPSKAVSKRRFADSGQPPRRKSGAGSSQLRSPHASLHPKVRSCPRSRARLGRASGSTAHRTHRPVPRRRASVRLRRVDGGQAGGTATGSAAVASAASRRRRASGGVEGLAGGHRPDLASRGCGRVLEAMRWARWALESNVARQRARAQMAMSSVHATCWQ
mmetsp:Transcript_85030/g.264174  ORF Transcript_85030/g.264174 Transcript_85030/m.264174 type:complete len:212 (-) Transcript_85030:13-648(-)